MKPVIAKEDVVNAIEALTAERKKPTIAALHAFLGNRGSLTTLVRFKREIDAECASGNGSEQSLKAFRELWQLAAAEGRKQSQTEVADLLQTVDELAAENERLVGQLAETNQRLANMVRQRDELIGELSRASEQVTAARASGEQSACKLAAALDKLVSEQELHRSEMKEVNARLALAEQHTRRFEIELARAEGRLSSQALAREEK